MGRAVSLSEVEDVPLSQEDAPATLRADVESVSRAVSNLVDNATRFAPADSVEIVVRGATLASGDIRPVPKRRIR